MDWCSIAREPRSAKTARSLPPPTGNILITNCRFIGSTEHGVVLQLVSGRVSDCEFRDIRKAALANLFFRKDADSRGNGISIEADTVVSGNVIENAPGFGISAGWASYLRDVSVTDNLIRNAHIGIGVSIDRSAGTALITDNLISGAKDGAIRAMNGPTPTGPDLARASAEAFPISPSIPASGAETPRLLRRER